MIEVLEYILRETESINLLDIPVNLSQNHSVSKPFDIERTMEQNFPTNQLMENLRKLFW